MSYEGPEPPEPTLDSLVNDCLDLRADLERVTRERDALQHDLDVTIAQKLDDLSTELEPLRSQLAEAKAEIGRLQIDRGMGVQLNSDLKAEVDRLRKALDAIRCSCQGRSVGIADRALTKGEK